MMDIRVVSICSRSGGEEVEIVFGISDGDGAHCDRVSFIISARQYLVLGIEKGESCEEQYDTVCYESTVWSCVKRGVAVLGYGSCSEKALRLKLVSKGFERDVADEAVRRIVGMGLMSANDDAVREAERMVRKLWGRRRIAAGLYEKGYSKESVAYALDAVEDMNVDFCESCRVLIEKKYGRALDADHRKKAFAYLTRYGYSAAEIKDALAKVIAKQ